MKFYKLIVNCEPSVIGVTNGFSQGDIIWKKFKNQESEKIIQAYFSRQKFIANKRTIETIDFTFEYVEAEKKAIMTDFFPLMAQICSPVKVRKGICAIYLMYTGKSMQIDPHSPLQSDPMSPAQTDPL